MKGVINPSDNNFLGGPVVRNLMLLSVFVYTAWKIYKK